MKPSPFAYHRPDDLEGALALLAEHGYDASVLAGGQSLVPVLSLRVARPTHIIDLNRISGLDDLGRRRWDARPRADGATAHGA